MGDDAALRVDRADGAAGDDSGPPAHRILFHVDLDAFYASVETLHNPALRDVPLVVGADPKSGRGRGVVVTANYAARAFGVRSAMPISTAWRLAPHATFVRPDFSRYKPASKRVMAVLARYADVLEGVGIDEAYLDVTQRCQALAADVAAAHAAITPAGTRREAGGEAPGRHVNAGATTAPLPPAGHPNDSPLAWDVALSLAHSLQSAVQRETGLSISVGIAPNKSVAKVASDARKPHGITRVRPHEVRAFLAPLSVRKLNGCGPKTAARLRDAGFLTVGDLAAADPADLASRFGVHGTWLRHIARGDDPRPVHADRGPAKSRGNERTFERDEREPARVLEAAADLLDELLDGLRRRPRPFATVAVKLRYSDFTTLTRAHTFPVPLVARSEWTAVQAHAWVRTLLQPLLGRRAVRLVGVRLSGFSQAGQRALQLFGVGGVGDGPAPVMRPKPAARPETPATTRRRLAWRPLHSL